MKATSDRIKEGMRIRDLKQSDLVERTGISKGAISSYISGKYIPKQNNIYLIAKALDVNEAWLMGSDVPMERKSPVTTLENLKILDFYDQLNELGKQEATKRVEELTYLPQYTMHILRNAAHSIDNASIEDRKFDEDIMDSPDF